MEKTRYKNRGGLAALIVSGLLAVVAVPAVVAVCYDTAAVKCNTDTSWQCLTDAVCSFDWTQPECCSDQGGAPCDKQLWGTCSYSQAEDELRCSSGTKYDACSNRTIEDSCRQLYTFPVCPPIGTKCTPDYDSEWVDAGPQNYVVTGTTDCSS